MATGTLWWLPGQGEWEQLTEKVRLAMARQILRGLKDAWPDDALKTNWERDRSGDKDAQPRPTPLRAFLRTAEWLPTQQPGHGGERFVPPRRCWTFPVRGDDSPPRFAPLMTRALRELLDDDAAALRRLRSLGLGVWGSDDDAPRLVRYLGALFNTGSVTEAHAAQFQNAYRAAWAACTRRGDEVVPFPPGERCYLVVDVASAATAMRLDPEGSERVPAEIVVAWREDEQSLLRLMADFGWQVLEVDTNPDAVTAILRRRLGDHVVRATDIAPVVLLDGREFDAATAGEVRPVVGEVRLGGETRALPERLHGVLPVQHAEHPTLIVEGADHLLTWATLEAMAEPMAYLIGRRDYARTFRWAAERTRRVSAPVVELGDDDIAEICDVNLEDVRAMARRIQSALTPLPYRLYPVVVHYTDAETAVPLDPEAPAVESEAEARSVLTALADRLGHDPNQLLTAALDAPNLAALQRQLAIPLRELNATLSSLGDRYPLIDYSQKHAEDFSDHLRQLRDRLLHGLRWARWDRFAAFDPQPDWTQLRRFESIGPDPDWGTTIDTLSPDLMDARIEEELARLLGAVPPTRGPALPRLSDCARANAELVDGTATRLAKLVRAWLVRQGLPIVKPWADEEEAGRDQLAATGNNSFLAAATTAWAGTSRCRSVTASTATKSRPRSATAARSNSVKRR